MLLSGFLFGLVSSLHCIGMCGPIALMLPIDRENQGRRALQILTYNAGRITSYSMIGLLFGLLGQLFFMAGLQQTMSIIAGVAMIAIAVIPEKLFARYNFSKPISSLIGSIRTSLGERLRDKSFKSLFTIGMFNGFLPCGMVYVALFGALAMQDVGKGILFMALFGLGTIPLMSMVSYIQTFVTIEVRNKIRHAIPFAIVAVGTLFILRGFGLGIPYISPSDMSLFVQSAPNCR